MSADNIPSVTSESHSEVHINRAQRHQDFIALATALNLADLAGAQAAFAAFQKDLNSSAAGNDGSQSNQANFYQQRNDSFQSLAQALNSGDLAIAQRAFSAFRQASQNIFLARNNLIITDSTPVDASSALQANPADDGKRESDSGASIAAVQFSG